MTRKGRERHRSPRFIAVNGRVPARFGSAFLGILLGLAVLTAAPPAPPLDQWRIAVDAGHGGSDRGVCDVTEDLVEKEINLDMAHRLAEALQTLGADVLLTRTDDTFIPLPERAQRANEFGAHLFLSLHVNRIPGHPECFGAQTFFFPNTPEGERLARLIQDELLGIDQENYRVAMPGRYRVLRETHMPAALVEVAFMTNARDRALLQDPAYREKVTGAVVQGILRFIAGEEAS